MEIATTVLKKSIFVYNFSCGNDYDCIEEWKVCDGKHLDCQNGWDELPTCEIDECLNKTLCDHTCHNLKIGYQCSCDKGYRLSTDKHSCEGELKVGLFVFQVINIVYEMKIIFTKFIFIFEQTVSVIHFFLELNLGVFVFALMLKMFLIF